MTRSVTIVNTSNWEHEDVAITVHPNRASQGNLPPLRLAPGEKHVVGPYDKDEVVHITLLPIEEREPAPFKNEDGSQDWPKIDIHKPKPGKSK